MARVNNDSIYSQAVSGVVLKKCVCDHGREKGEDMDGEGEKFEFGFERSLRAFVDESETETVKRLKRLNDDIIRRLKDEANKKALQKSRKDLTEAAKALNLSNAERQRRRKDSQEKKGLTRRSVWVHFHHTKAGLDSGVCKTNGEVQPAMETCIAYLLSKNVPDEVVLDTIHFWEVFGFNAEKYVANTKRPKEET